MKKYIILFSIVFVIAIIFLYLYNTAEISNNKSNGFKRNFSAGTIKIDKAIKNEFKMQKLIGMHNSRYYFVSFGADYLLSTDLNLNDPQKIPLNKKYVRGTTYGFDSTYIYAYSVNENAVSIYNHEGREEGNVVLKDQFSRVIALTSSIFVIKDFKKIMDGVTFVRIKVDSSLQKQVKLNEIRIESYKNNPFANDGLLIYDKDSGTVVYMNYYHNDFFVLDTSFSKAVKHETIDTTSLAKVFSKSVKSDNKVGITNYSPANIINRSGALKNGKIHILSNLVSDNQDKSQFLRTTTVDVYQVQSGKYLYSYILPDCNANKVKELFLTDAGMISIYPDSIIQYRMN